MARGWREITGPVSSPASMRMIEIPVSRSPARIARWIGAAPRQRGSREAWILSAPRGATVRKDAGRITPYAATTMTSGRCSRSALNSASPRRSGCATRSPCARATRFTALGVGCMPRPAGRSGWVTTNGIWCPAFSKRSSARDANSGVPAKTRRRKAGSGRLAKLLRQLGADALLLQLREVLDEHLALQVIHLVLDADREQPLGLERERLAVLIVGAHLDALGALHQLVDAGHGKATFLDVRLSGRFHDLGVHQHDQRVVPVGDVDHDDLLVHVDLGGREADARRRVHGFGHVGDELLQALVEHGDRRSDLVEAGVGVAEDVQNRHLRANSLAI